MRKNYHKFKKKMYKNCPLAIRLSIATLKPEFDNYDNFAQGKDFKDLSLRKYSWG